MLGGNMCFKISKKVLFSLFIFFIISAPARSNDELSEVLVYASLTPVLKQNSANSITIVDGDDIRNRGVLNIGQILRDVPGLAVSQTGGYGAQMQIRARGSESNHLLVLIDGVEANDPSQNDEFVWGTLSLADIDRIEVIRGPQSSINGSDALSGKINIITRAAKENGGEFFSQIGSWNTSNSGFNFNRVGEQYSIRAGFNHTSSDGHNISRVGNEDDGYQNTTLNINSAFQINSELSVSAVARKSTGMVEYDSDDDFDGLVEDQEKHSDFDNLTAKIDALYTPAGSNWRHEFRVAESHFDNEAYADDVKGNVTASEKSQVRYLASYVYDDASFSLLLEKEKEDWMQRGEISWGIYDPNQDRTRETDSVALEYRTSSLENLIIGLSGRHESNSEFGNSSTYRGELVYKISDVLRVRGLVGKSIKNPTFTERFGFYTNFIGNPLLKPEESVGFEIGMDYVFENEQIDMSLTLFNADLENEINGFVYDPVTYAYTSGNMNGSSNRKGLEISLVGDLTETLSFSSSYTHVKADQKNDGTRVREIRRPNHMANFGINWAPSSSVKVMMNSQFVGSQLDTYYPPFPANPEQVKMADHTLVDLSINYEMSDDLMILLTIENVFDDNYEEVFGYKTLGLGGSVGFRYQM